MDEIEQCKKELSRERSKVSDSANDIINFSNTESDPLRDGVADAQNPFRSTKTCVIL